MYTFKCLKCKKEGIHKYQKRQFCSRSCKSSYINLGEKHPQWCGDNVSYNGLHKWIQRNFGKPVECHDCKLKGEKTKSGKWNVWWSNQNGKYSRCKNDWVGRCRKCHYHYDKQFVVNEKYVYMNGTMQKK